MRILISNDDGVAAPGLALLADAARELSEDVLIVAPERKWTAASHQLTFDREQTLTRIEPGVYACSGAPADCIVAAMTVWQEKCDSVTAASPGRSAGMSAGGFFGSNVRVFTSGAARSMTTAESLEVVVGPRDGVLRSARASGANDRSRQRIIARDVIPMCPSL